MNRYGETRSGLSMLLALVVMLGTQVLLIFPLVGRVLTRINLTAPGGFDGYIDAMMEFAMNPWLLTGSNLLVIISIPLLFYLLYKRPLRQMGLYRKGFFRQLLLGLLFGAAAIGAVFGVMMLIDNVRVVAVDYTVFKNPVFWASLTMFIAVGFGEEVIFRGYMMTAAKTMRNKALILFVPAIVFALMHIANPGINFLSLFNIFCAGLIMALLFVKTGRIWASVGFHITWNFMQGCIFGMNVSGMPVASLLKVEFAGLDYLSGGAFGAEGSLIATGIVILCVLFAAFVVRKSKDRPWTYFSDLPFAKIRPYQPPVYYYPPQAPPPYPLYYTHPEANPTQPQAPQPSFPEPNISPPEEKQ